MYHVIDFNPKHTRALSAHTSGAEASIANPDSGFTSIISSSSQLALHTMGELVELFNVLKSKDTQAVNKFKSKGAGATRIMKLLESKPKSAQKKQTATTQAKKFSVKATVRRMLSKDLGITVEDLATASDSTPATVRTHLSDLKNAKYAGKEGPMDIYKVGDLFYVR